MKLLWLIIYIFLVLLTGASFAPKAEGQSPSVAVPGIVLDARIAPLQAFLVKYRCPDRSSELLATADKFGLDYRLLPVIWLKESTCGKHAIKGSNNEFGWASGKTKFASFQDSLFVIADKLVNGKYYKGKTTVDKMRAYNPNPAYSLDILRLMKSVDSPLK